MDIEEQEKLPFLDVLMIKKGNETYTHEQILKSTIISSSSTIKLVKTLVSDEISNVTCVGDFLLRVLSYTRQTNRRIIRREDRNAVLKKEPSPTLAQHRLLTGHSINFNNSKILAKSGTPTTRIIRKEIEIEKKLLTDRPNKTNANRNELQPPYTYQPHNIQAYGPIPRSHARVTQLPPST
ncbi:hypothetical protein Trydic_g3952 [Trypoxylus dichotomus]